MKRLLFIFLVVCLVGCTTRNTKRTYTGTIVEKSLLPTSSCNSATTATMYIHFHCPELDKTVTVKVYFNEYDHAEVGDSFSYRLSPKNANDRRSLNDIRKGDDDIIN